jgi:hypothetical protein
LVVGMMSKRDYELIAEVVYNLPHFKNPLQSHGLQRRAIALKLARAFEDQKHNKRFDRDTFLMRAENGI